MLYIFFVGGGGGGGGFKFFEKAPNLKLNKKKNLTIYK
jgi:hypothetical protein